MAEGLDASGTTAVRETDADWSAPAKFMAPMIDRRDYDVGPGCPRDELQRRLDEARARLRLHPPKLAAPLGWSI